MTVTDDNFNKDDIVDGVLNNLADQDLSTFETPVIWAVDSTLRYVIEWLENTGHAAKADILKRLGDL